MDPLRHPEEFGRRVSAARGYMQAKKTEFAKAMGTSVPTVVRWEKGEEASIGRTVPAREQLAQQIVETSGCPAEWFGIYPADNEVLEELERRYQRVRETMEAHDRTVNERIAELEARVRQLTEASLEAGEQAAAQQADSSSSPSGEREPEAES